VKTNRKTLISILSISLLAAACFGSARAKPENLDQRRDIYQRFNRALVSVEFKTEMTILGQSEDLEERVLGISLGKDGLVLFDGSMLRMAPGLMASGHRVEKPKVIMIHTFDDREYDAEYIGLDNFSGIAFCRLPEEARGQVETVSFEKENLEVGSGLYFFWMLPENFEPRFQMAQTEVTGILSKPEKYFLLGELISEFNLSPVTTTEGKLVGLVVPVNAPARTSPFGTISGDPFENPMAIMPYDELEKLIDDPPVAGTNEQGWMGIALQALDPKIADFWNVNVDGGIIISEVIRNSPAEKAGVQAGDFLTQINGEPLEITKDANIPVFQRMISDFGAGTSIDLTLYRPLETGVDTIKTVLTLSKPPLPASEAPSYEDKHFEITVRDMVFDDYNRRLLDEGEIKGVVVDKLEQGGWADVAGLFPGDIILKIDGKDVPNAEKAEAVFTKVREEKKKDVVFLIWRNNRTSFLNVKTHW
jgi:serine protease Do